MAHVFRMPENKARKLLKRCAKKNLIDGIEVYHPSHTPEQIEFLKDFARQHSLLMSGGSDSHAPSEPLGVNATFDWRPQSDLL